MRPPVLNGTTACSWDSVIPFDEMWLRLNKLIKPNGAIVLFGSEPFSSALRMSNIKNYKYDWVWEKEKSTDHLNSKFRPMKKHELISVFSDGSSSFSKKENYMMYNPQGLIDIKPKLQKRNGVKSEYTHSNHNIPTMQKQTNFPTTILKINGESKDRVHPTQKPVALMEYLIKTYTNENESVLDFTMGSGTTGVACKNLGRDFIGIEMGDGYFEIAKNRIKDTVVEKKGLLYE